MGQTALQATTDLHAITSLDGLYAFYEGHGLGSTKEVIDKLPEVEREALFTKRINLLRSGMNVTAVRCECGSTAEDALMLLEDVVIFDKWMLKP